MSVHPTMGIGTLGNFSSTRHRKFRWTFQATFPSHSFKEDFVRVNARPSLNVDESDINYLSAKTWIPGKSSWTTLDTTYLDFDCNDPKNDDFVKAIAHAWEKVGKNEPQEQGVGILSLYDPCGALLETWTLEELEIQEVNFQELDHSGDDTCLEVTWRHKAVRYECFTAGYPPAPCTISPVVRPSSPVGETDGQVEPLLSGKPE